MDIYLDNCSLHRPLDDRTQLRIQLEAEAVLSIIILCEQGIHALISSEALVFEARRNPNAQSREIISEILTLATSVVSITDAVKHRATAFEANGFGSMDALHLACAEAAGAEYFCTCDDRLLKRAKHQRDSHVKVVSPLELAEEIM